MSMSFRSFPQPPEGCPKAVRSKPAPARPHRFSELPMPVQDSSAKETPAMGNLSFVLPLDFDLRQWSTCYNAWGTHKFLE